MSSPVVSPQSGSDGARGGRRLRVELSLVRRAAWAALVQLVNGPDMTHAAAIAYYALLSMFPFLLLVISLLGVVTADDAQRQVVLNFVLRYFPARLDFVSTQLDAFRTSRIQVGVAGTLALIWSSLGVFGAVTSAVNEAWGVEKRRSYLKHRLVSFLMLAAAGSLMVVSLLLVMAIRVAETSWFGTLFLQAAWLRSLQSWTLRYLATLVLIAGVGCVYYFVPNARTRFRDVWVGAAVTGLLWRGAFELFSATVASNTRLALIQGSIASVVVFLLWIYVSAIILMYGVEFTAAHAKLRRHRASAV